MSTLNVFRYAALISGVAFGFSHDLCLKTEAAKKQEEYDYQHEIKLIDEAKKEYKKLNPPKVSSTGAINLEDPDLDFAKVILGAVESLEN